MHERCARGRAKRHAAGPNGAGGKPEGDSCRDHLEDKFEIVRGLLSVALLRHFARIGIQRAILKRASRPVKVQRVGKALLGPSVDDFRIRRVARLVDAHAIVYSEHGSRDAQGDEAHEGRYYHSLAE